MIALSPYRSFLFLCVVSVVLWWHTIVTTVALALRSDEYTHIFLILPISVSLILSEWRSRRARPEPNFRAGSALLVLAVLIGFIGGVWRRGSVTADMQLSLGMLALVVWWIGTFICCFGARIFRLCVFPLCFLLWLIPVPEFALNRIVGFLQQGSASAAHLFFTIVRTPVAQDGVVLSLPGLTVEVAKECSSIRSSLMLMVTSMVVAQLLLRTAWGKTLVTLAAIPFSIAKNGLRIFTLSMLGIYVDPGFLNGKLHHHGGVLFFLLALAGMFVLLSLVRWAECTATAQPAVSYVAPMIAAQKTNPQ